jgi:hypothetical protein
MLECRRFLGKHLTVSYYGYAPYIVYPKRNSRRSETTGSDIHVLEALAKHLGFSYSLKKETSMDIVTDKNGSNHGLIWEVCTVELS